MIELRTAAAAQDVDLIHRFLSQESTWARGIPRQLVQRAIDHSLNFGLFETDDVAGPGTASGTSPGTGAQIAYARVVTDQATFAYVMDVFVLPAHRGQGHSRRLMQAVLSHPALQGLRRMVLVSSTARGLYAQFGFEPLARPDTYMEIHRPDAYAAQAPNQPVDQR